LHFWESHDHDGGRFIEYVLRLGAGLETLSAAGLRARSSAKRRLGDTLGGPVVGARCGSFGPDVMIIIIALSMAFNGSKLCLVNDTRKYKLQVVFIRFLAETSIQKKAKTHAHRSWQSIAAIERASFDFRVKERIAWRV
jgi:hypothetical protein